MIKHITLEEAKENYYPKPAGMSVRYTDAYTLTPDNNESNSEHVHYWVKQQRFDARLSFNQGYIYILENKGQAGILKIGYTDRTPQQRLQEINGGTGVIIPWYIVNSFACKSPEHIETLVHQALSQYHVNKEGFNISIREAERIIDKIIADSNAAV